MSLFRRRFSNILLVKTNYLVSTVSGTLVENRLIIVLCFNLEIDASNFITATSTTFEIRGNRISGGQTGLNEFLVSHHQLSILIASFEDISGRGQYFRDP